ncbi:MAG: glycosyltransferase [Pseudoflavonifractor sp.]|nr:glycosyltransferase [Pseudoflavonifractor sp.]
MKRPLISVIVPVYNVEKYLGTCIDSLVSQTYPNIEIILIDDGSTDNSGSICDMYSETHSNISVYHEPNGGSSVARNKGIDVSTGEYICFVDSDDWADKHMIESLYGNIAAYDADIATCQEVIVTDEGCRSHREHGGIRLTDAMAAVEDILYQRDITPAPWCKLFRRSLFDSLRFPPGILYEDLALIYRLFEISARIVVSGERLYYYRQRRNSNIGGFKLRRLDVLDVTDEIERHISETTPRLLPAARDRRLSANFNMMQLLLANGYADSPYADRCWENIKCLRYGSLTNPKVRLKNKVGIIVSLFGRRFFQLISRVVS